MNRLFSVVSGGLGFCAAILLAVATLLVSHQTTKADEWDDCVAACNAACSLSSDPNCFWQCMETTCGSVFSCYETCTCSAAKCPASVKCDTGVAGCDTKCSCNKISESVCKCGAFQNK
jgi:hypothetical protein